MKLVPSLNVTRFAQLASGDLFIAPLGNGSMVAMVAEDPTRNGQKYLVPLGPVFPTGSTGPSLLRMDQLTVISFGKNFLLRLPVGASGWSVSPQVPETSGILVTDSGAYIRVDAGQSPGAVYCYVEIATGRINAAGKGAFEQYAPPNGIAALALEWELVTDEPEPRSILAYPFS